MADAGAPQPTVKPDSLEEASTLIDDLRAQLASLQATGDAKASQEKKKQGGKKKGGKKSLKAAKGTRDFGPRQMATRRIVFDAIKDIFEKHGAETIDTPVFELRSTLMDKYGEDSKLIYNLEDQGGEILSLRYDLTVPFARFCGMNKIEQIKRYHIAKVYRRDQPAIERGRFREFYQCDFDICGDYERMVPDSEVLKIISEILSSPKLGLGDFTIKVNDRNILDGILAACGVPADKVRPACSAVDKLDKMCWEGVRKEMVEDKQIPAEVADAIGKYVYLNGKLDSENVAESSAMKLVEKLASDEKLQNDSMKTGLENMRRLLDFCHILGVKSELQFDLSLARGLDYYTATIYEAVLCGTEVGSVSGGGRYDGLVNGLAGSKKQIPCVGMSIGIERIMAIIDKRLADEKVKTTSTQVLVISPQKGTLKDRMKLLSELWEAGISAETQQKNNVKMLTQLQHCENKMIPLAAVLANDEIEQGVVKLRHIATRKEWIVQRQNVAAEIKDAIAKHERGDFVQETVPE